MRTLAADVLFVFPPASRDSGAFRDHLGAAYLRAALAERGITTRQYRDEIPGTLSNVVDTILQSGPKVIGFTVYETNFSLAIAIADRVKARRSSIRIIFGGPTATFSAERILESQPSVDACVRGEAEEVGPEIFTSLLDDHDPPGSQPGFSFRRHGQTHDSPLPPLIGRSQTGTSPGCVLDSTPSPYLSGILDDGRPGILTSRGCTHHCQYCAFAAIARKTLRLHSVDRILAELDFISRHQRRTRQHYGISVNDDAFTLLPERAKTLCRAIAQRKLNLQLSCLTRADRLDDELLHLMREAGFFAISFGLESAVPSVLRSIGKVRPPDWPDPDLTPERMFLDQIRLAVSSAKALGFKVNVSIILGLPSESRQDGQTTLRFVDALPVDSYAHNFLRIYPGTPLWTNHDHYGIRCIVDDTGVSADTVHAYDVSSLAPAKQCTLEQDVRLLRLSTIDHLFSCQTSPGTRRGLHSAILRAPFLTDRSAAWLGDTLDVGAAFLHLLPTDPGERFDELFERDLELLDSHRLFLRVYAKLLPKRHARSSDHWLIASASHDLYRVHRPDLLTIAAASDLRPLRRWLAGRSSRSAFYDLDGAPSVANLARRHSFPREDLPTFFGGMPIPPGIKYPGRWQPGVPPCQDLSRLEIDADGSIRTCRYGLPLGRVGDSRAALFRRFREYADQAERRRACASCRNPLCPRCPFPGLDDVSYCQIMCEESGFLALLSWSTLFARLPLKLTDVESVPKDA